MHVFPPPGVCALTYSSSLDELGNHINWEFTALYLPICKVELPYYEHEVYLYITGFWCSHIFTAGVTL